MKFVAASAVGLGHVPPTTLFLRVPPAVITRTRTLWLPHSGVSAYLFSVLCADKEAGRPRVAYRLPYCLAAALFSHRCSRHELSGRLHEQRTECFPWDPIIRVEFYEMCDPPVVLWSFSEALTSLYYGLQLQFVRHFLSPYAILTPLSSVSVAGMGSVEVGNFSV